MTDKPKKPAKKGKPDETELSEDELGKVEGGFSFGTSFNTVSGGNTYITWDPNIVGNTADGGLAGNTATGSIKGTDQLKR